MYAHDTTYIGFMYFIVLIRLHAKSLLMFLNLLIELNLNVFLNTILNILTERKNKHTIRPGTVSLDPFEFRLMKLTHDQSFAI